MKPLVALLASAVLALGANPYLHLPDDKPVVREFKGEEWDQDRIGINEKGDGSRRAPLFATVTTIRLETMPWGEIYRITFRVLPAASERNVGPYYLLVTDNEILQLNSVDMDRELRVIRAMKKQPRFEKADVVALTKGALKFKDGPWVTEVSLKGGGCHYQRWHDGSGHFGRMVWRKGEGLVQVAMGRGAELTGYDLKLDLSAAKK
ncbi:MAG: hypothetical protein ABIP20_07910 [Chthoniobacteraceae bacterium]